MSAACCCFEQAWALTCAGLLPGVMRWGTLGVRDVSGPRPQWLCTWRWSSARKGGRVRSRTPLWGWTPCPAETLSGKEGPARCLWVEWRGLEDEAKWEGEDMLKSGEGKENLRLMHEIMVVPYNLCTLSVYKTPKHHLFSCNMVFFCPQMKSKVCMQLCTAVSSQKRVLHIVS